MASYRPFAPPPPPPPSSFPPPPPPQNPSPNLPPPPIRQQQYPHHSLYNRNSSFNPNPNSNFNRQPPPPPLHRPHPQQQQQQFQFSAPPPPPPNPNPNSYYPPPPPPPPVAPPPPPPPSSPPPPPPPIALTSASLPPKLPQQKARPDKGKGVETEEERRARKKREYEKQRAEERRQHMLKQSQASVLQKTKEVMGGSGGLRHGHGHGHGHGQQHHQSGHHHGSASAGGGGSRAMDKRTAGFLSGDRIENRLKKPTTFICKMKFRNELPDPTAQPKLLPLNLDKDRYTRYQITPLEKNFKPQLYVEPDLGIPLDLLDIRVYNRPQNPRPLDPEDEELVKSDDEPTPVKVEGIRKKERPTDEGMSWLVKTQYISPLSADSAKLSLTEKQAKEMRDAREGRNVSLENINSRERQIQAIEESFKAAKLPPVHQKNPSLKPVEILPLLPDLDRYEDKFVMVAFDGEPTADCEPYNKLGKSVRDEHESQAIMKSFVVNGSDPSKPEKFLSYMVPEPDEIKKDMFDENEDRSYSWVREYHWDVRVDDADDPQTYLVNFGDKDARYLPLATKLVLQKKRAKEGRSSDEIEHYPVPSKVTVRRRSAVSVGEQKQFEKGSSSSHDKGDTTNWKRGRSSREYEFEERHNKLPRIDSMDQFSGEEDLSD